MKIVVVTTSLSGGGAEFVARTWAEWLAAQGHDVRAATLTPREEERAEGVRVLRLARRGHVAAARALRRLLTDEPADAVVSLQNYPNLVALTALPGMRRRPALLVSERNITSREGEPFGLQERVRSLLARRLYRHADTVVAISHPVAAELVSAYGVTNDRLIVVPNPAGRRAEDRGERARPPMSADGPLHLVLPMRLVPQKRAEAAVAAAAALRTRGVDARIVCFGRGPLLPRLESAAVAADVPLAVPGWTSDWVADSPPNAVAVLPSYREGFGNVLVEAAMGGIPSVAVSSAYGVADALVPTISGELALTADPDDLADAILRARDAGTRMGSGRVQSWTRRFSTDSSGGALLAAIAMARERRAGTKGGTP